MLIIEAESNFFKGLFLIFVTFLMDFSPVLTTFPMDFSLILTIFSRDF